MQGDWPESGAAFYRLISRVLVVLLVVATLWVLHLFGRVLPVQIWLLVLALLTVVIGYGGWQRKRCRRAAWLSVYVQAASPWQQRLRGGGWMLAGQLCLGFFWALVLSAGVLRLQGVVAWWLLLLNLPLLVLAHAVVSMVSRRHVATKVLDDWSWRGSVLLLAAALLPVMVWQALYISYPMFADVSLERAVWHMMEQEQAYSPLIHNLLQLAAAKDGLRLWLAQQWMPAVASSTGEVLVWGIVVLDQALLVWPCLLLCQGAVLWAGPNEH